MVIELRSARTVRMQMIVYQHKTSLTASFEDACMHARVCLLPVAHQSLFTSSVTRCEIHGMHHPRIHSSYATEQLLCKQQL